MRQGIRELRTRTIKNGQRRERVLILGMLSDTADRGADSFKFLFAETLDGGVGPVARGTMARGTMATTLRQEALWQEALWRPRTEALAPW